MPNYIVFHETEFEKSSQTNSRKSLIPLFILEILELNTSYCKQFSQEDILRRLDAYPYSSMVDRRTVSRNLKMLMEEFPIRKGSDGVYYDRFAA